MHWLSTQHCGLDLHPSGLDIHTQEIKSADKRGCVCINKWKGMFVWKGVRRFLSVESIHINTNIHRENQPCTGTPPVPPLSPLVFTKKSRRQPIFQRASGIQKQPSAFWPPVLCQDKMCFLPTTSSVFLSFPELYLPHIIVNCLLSEIYSVRRSDS